MVLHVAWLTWSWMTQMTGTTTRRSSTSPANGASTPLGLERTQRPDLTVFVILAGKRRERVVTVDVWHKKVKTSSIMLCPRRILGLCLLQNELCPITLNRHVIKVLLGRKVGEG